MRKDCSIILKTLDGWPQKVKTMQKNWIGNSVGAEVNFEIKGFDKRLLQDIYDKTVIRSYGVNLYGNVAGASVYQTSSVSR